MLRVVILVPAGGFGVPGTCGPHTALGTEAGMGGVPGLKQMMTPTYMTWEHPFQAQVCWLNWSS